jgi:hypothetical protein
MKGRGKMKRLLAIAMIICLVLSLVGCGGSPAPASQDNSEPAEEGSKEPAKDSSTESAKAPVQEMTINTGIGKEGGEVKVQTGQGIAWDTAKMGGMPQPEGTTVYMEMDLTQTLGIEFAYSYMLTGLTKEVYQEYIKLVTKSYPQVMENVQTDKEATFLATSEDLKHSFMVTFIDDGSSMVQYHISK